MRKKGKDGSVKFWAVLLVGVSALLALTLITMAIDGDEDGLDDGY